MENYIFLVSLHDKICTSGSSPWLHTLSNQASISWRNGWYFSCKTLHASNIYLGTSSKPCSAQIIVKGTEDYWDLFLSLEFDWNHCVQEDLQQAGTVAVQHRLTALHNTGGGSQWRLFALKIWLVTTHPLDGKGGTENLCKNLWNIYWGSKHF